MNAATFWICSRCKQAGKQQCIRWEKAVAHCENCGRTNKMNEPYNAIRFRWPSKDRNWYHDKAWETPEGWTCDGERFSPTCCEAAREHIYFHCGESREIDWIDAPETEPRQAFPVQNGESEK